MVFFEKSQPAPDCLAIEKAKKSEDYRCGDVYIKLQTDFKNKCYLCEKKAPTAINLEHFVPHRGDRDLMFDWENLFFSCVHCNMTKRAKAANDFLLNCTKEPQIDEKIEHHFEPFPKESVKIVSTTETKEAINTAALLQAIFDGNTTLKKLESANLRTLLRKEVVKFTGLLDKFNSNDLTPKKKERFRRRIINHLQNDSAFTAFKRQIVRGSSSLNEIFSGTF